MKWPRVLWFDPGQVSGAAVVYFDPIHLFSPDLTASVRAVVKWNAWMISGGENHQVLQMLKAIKAHGGDEGLYVGVESFVLGQFNQSSALLSPVRLRAALEFACWSGVTELDGVKRARSPLGVQSPSDAKNICTDERLRAWGMWTPGPDHPRDATKHCLLWLRKLRQAGPKALEVMCGGEPVAWQSMHEQRMGELP